jgi:hypothetical protein
MRIGIGDQDLSIFKFGKAAEAGAMIASLSVIFHFSFPIIHFLKSR